MPGSCVLGWVYFQIGLAYFRDRCLRKYALPPSLSSYIVHRPWVIKILLVNNWTATGLVVIQKFLALVQIAKCLFNQYTYTSQVN